MEENDLAVVYAALADRYPRGQIPVPVKQALIRMHAWRYVHEDPFVVTYLRSYARLLGEGEGE